MAADCNVTQGALLDFLREKADKVKQTDLIERFKAAFPEDPEKKAAARNAFKNYVDNIAFVKAESGVKYVCLKKKFRVSGTDPGAVLNGDKVISRPGREDCRPVSADDAAEDPAQPQIPPGSGYGNDSQVRFPRAFSPAPTDDKGECHEFVCIADGVGCNSGVMGNRGSFRREQRRSTQTGSKAPGIPEITVIEASPLPAEGSVFALPGPAQTGSTGRASADGLAPTDRQVETLSLGGPREAERVDVVARHADEGEDEGQLDAHSWSGSEGSPKGSRKHFIEVMMNSSTQVRRSLVLRHSVCLSSRSDSDSASLVSSTLDDDRASVTLDPLEHEWMMCASDGEWGSLYRLLATEPSLVLRKDFVTGFTCLHWAAKHGKPELLALIINFAKQHHVPISVDVRTNTGYTPLHIAAMHNHMEVVKLLVGAYSADVEIRDYSGRKACQYLTDNVSVDIRDIIGEYEHSNSESADQRDGGRWRFSKVLQTNLRPRRLFLNPADCESMDGEAPRPREKPVRRKSSLSRMRPKLERIRRRASQVVHSTTFRDSEEQEGSTRGSFRSRPKTHFFW